MDFGEGVVEVINPEIVERKGKQEDVEGCLSCPGEYGITRRPRPCQAQGAGPSRRGILRVKGEDLVARCMCHETDHLDGILFKEHVIRMLDPEEIGEARSGQ